MGTEKVHVQRLTARIELKCRLMEAWRDRESFRETHKRDRQKGSAFYQVFFEHFYKSPEKDRQKYANSTNPLNH
jgi:hypothetical protein